MSTSTASVNIVTMCSDVVVDPSRNMVLQIMKFVEPRDLACSTTVLTLESQHVISEFIWPFTLPQIPIEHAQCFFRVPTIVQLDSDNSRQARGNHPLGIYDPATDHKAQLYEEPRRTRCLHRSRERRQVAIRRRLTSRSRRAHQLD